MNNIELPIKYWNDAVKLRSPSLGGLQETLAIKEVVPVFSHAPFILYATTNLVITLPLGTKPSKSSPVQSVSLVLTCKYFSGDALVRTLDLPNLAMFGVPLSGSAEEFRQRLHGAGHRGLELLSEAGRWTIRYGKALSFEFEGTFPSAADPGESVMIEVNFNYGLPYAGSIPPLLERLQ